MGGSLNEIQARGLPCDFSHERMTPFAIAVAICDLFFVTEESGVRNLHSEFGQHCYLY